MKTVLMHAKNFMVEFDSLANRPKNIVHEEINGKEKQTSKDCVVALITVEKEDNEEEISGIVGEVIKMCGEIKRRSAVIVPFAHLSNNLEEPRRGLEVIREIEVRLREKIEVIAAHFGSNKSLLLDIYGHTGNVRFREF
jgi:threonyl-tRNA synthetase